MEQMKRIIEAALMAAERPLTVENLQRLFEENTNDNLPSNKEIKEVLQILSEDYKDRAVNLIEVASGYRFQICKDVAPWVQKLWQERPPRYSRALLETLALIVYRQPITRAEIEDVRGVSVSTTVIKTLLEREWVRIVGHKDLPGKPALYATTKQFLDDLNLKSLEELPSLMEIQDLDQLENQLNIQLKLDVAPTQNAGENSEESEHEATTDAVTEHAETSSSEDGEIAPSEKNTEQAYEEEQQQTG